MSDINPIMDEIARLPHFRDIACAKCSANMRAHVLQMYVNCPTCGARYKCRGFGAIGCEIEDLIDAVLRWGGTGEQLEAVMRRHAEIQADPDLDEDE